MKAMRVVLVFGFLAALILTGRDSHAIIYKYVNEKGETLLVDDLLKIPEASRPSATVVSGVAVDEQEEARNRSVVIRQAEMQAQSQPEPDHGLTLRGRLILSGCVTCMIVVLLVVSANVEALKKYEKAVRRARTALGTLLVLFLAVVHGRDVIDLFNAASDAVRSKQEESAARGRKAAQFYKAVDRVMEQGAAGVAGGEQTQHGEDAADKH